MEAVQTFKYNGQDIEFALDVKNSLMVNATEMAKIFGTDLNKFTRNDTTKAFIKACLKTPDSTFLGIKKETDLIVSKQKSGTWMHRILALKFAAWLNPDFEVWVYRVIDELLFGSLKSRQQFLKERTLTEIEIEELTKKLDENPDWQRLKSLRGKREEAKKELQRLDAETVNSQMQLWQNN